MAGIVSVMNETRSSSSRYTREGKKITYSLDVIQQPERARACGSGAKSSADRRPVDPPPIVVLRVFEGEALNEITFSYNANFFLFATLENARTMAQGRLQPSQASIPVLTGTPVAGMSYLDRPSPAGYFIFPDLSVRHEGKYRLSFTLYEQIKDNKDADADDHATFEIPQINAHVSHRLEVKSTPFIVYSAKKFPGLAESTTLSTTVAEQGCRVRIRKDVRMRRRETKQSRDWDNYEDQSARERARRTATPDAYGQQHVHNMAALDGGRSRSASLVSNGNATPVSLQQRRPSVHESPQTYQNEYAAPQTPHQQGYHQHVSHGSGMQYSYPHQYAVQQPSPVQQQQHQQQVAALSSPHHHYSQYQTHQYQQQQPHYQPMMQPPQTPYLSNAQSYHQQAYASQHQSHGISQSPHNAQLYRQAAPGVEFNPSANERGEAQKAQNGTQVQVSSGDAGVALHSHSHPGTNSYHTSAPDSGPVVSQVPSVLYRNVNHGPGNGQSTLLQPQAIKLEPACTMAPYNPITASSGVHESRERHQVPIVTKSEDCSAFQNVNVGSKRKPIHDHENGRLINGERPSETFAENGSSYNQLSDEDIEQPDKVAMKYRRADGTIGLRVVSKPV